MMLEQLLKELPIDYARSAFEKEVLENLDYLNNNYNAAITQQAFEEIQNKYFQAVVGLIIKAQTIEEILAYLENAKAELNKEKEAISFYLHQRQLAQKTLESITEGLFDYLSPAFFSK